MIHPSPDRIRQLTERWTGQDARLQRIAESMLAGEDWTGHLRGLPFADEIPPREGEAYGRDLRGANLRSLLHPKIEVTPEMVRERPDLKKYTGHKLTVIAWLWARTVESP